MQVIPFLLFAAIPYVLPPSAIVIEARKIPTAAHADRVVVLWMEGASLSPCWDEAEPYAPSCPDATRGCHYSGPTRISLIDTRAARLINTISVSNPDTGEDRFDVPYLIENDGPYLVPGPKKYGKPRLLRFRDLNGDGSALEFALFDAQSCSDMYIATFGYSRKQDRLLQYLFRLADADDPASDPFVSDWIENFAFQHPVSRFTWHWKVVHPGGEEEYDVRYDPSLEQFEGTVRSVEQP